jgi:hypothetical protein
MIVIYSSLDAYLRIIGETDRVHTPLVLLCGMGAIRTTFAMVAASLLRRKQMIVYICIPFYTKSRPKRCRQRRLLGHR